MTEMMTTVVTVALVMKVKTFLMMATVKVQTFCTKQKMEQNTRKKSTTINKVCEVQQEKRPRKLIQGAAYAFCTMAK